jgi:SAM-dependent methyltransferase
MRYSTEGVYQNEPTGVRPSFGSDRVRALRYYSRFVDFITRVCPPLTDPNRLTLLDIGCGSGWSTHALACAGYDASGIDLNAHGFEASPLRNMRLQEGSALKIPFPDETFDVVVSFQVIEHLPSPERALEEMARVCRAGGVICVVGPNLLSPFLAPLYLLKPASWRRMTYRRRPGMPWHPYGNTLWEIASLIPVRAVQLIGKLLGGSPHFTMRIPDSTLPFYADNDACYLCNPTDLIAWFKTAGWHLLRRGRHGRPPLSYLLAGGTWVAARKPGAG